MDNPLLMGVVGVGAVAGLFYLIRLAITTTRILLKIDEMLPVMFAMAAQFKSDSGSTLKDQVNALQVAAQQNKIASDTARESAREAGEVARFLQLSMDTVRLEQVRLTVAAERVASITANIVTSARDANSVDVATGALVSQLVSGAGAQQQAAPAPPPPAAVISQQQAIDKAQIGLDVTQKGVEAIQKGIDEIKQGGTP